MHDMFDVKEVDLSLKDEENFRDWVSYCGWTRKAGKWYNAKIKKWLTNVDIFDSYNSTNKSAFRIPIAQAS
jgi:O-methyltransferase involved in polyketide biosynthesis